MWIDLPNWQATSSFVEPVAPPGVEPLAAPLVCLQVNATWLPYITGALMQLAQPAAWATTDPTALATVLQQAQDLISEVGGAEGCTMPTFRFRSGCVLQSSLDGGATWTDIPGWPTFAPGCYTGATGAPGTPGAPGAPGGFTPGTPGNPQGVSTGQQACNIAGFLATDVIQVSLQQVVTSIGASQTALQTFSALAALVFGVDVIGDLFLLGVNVIYDAYLSGTRSDYTAALADASFWSRVTCAIYGAIVTDGYVTAANFAAVVSAVGAVSYAHADVVTTLVAYLNNLGATGLMSVQIPGALAVIDCAPCAPGYGGALFFEGGTGSGMTLASDLLPSGGFTIGGWFNSSSTFTSSVIFRSGDGSSGGQQTVLYINGGHTLNWLCENAVTNINITYGSLPSGANVHIVATVDNTALRLYVNGTQVAALGALVGPWAGSGGKSTFAMSRNGSAALVAVLWGWAAYNTALSASDIAAWHSSGSFAAPPGSPAHYWPMNDGSGAVVADTAGGDTGALTGTYAWTSHT